jgi:anti-sigma factor RsiW
MSCPAEEVIVAFMQGTIAPTERSRIEEHLDTCPACTALLAGLGHAFGSERSLVPSDEAPREADVSSGALLRLQGAMAVLHVWGAVLAAAPLRRVVAGLRAGPLTAFEILVLALGAWTYVGLPWALANVRALRLRSPHARRSVLWYSAVASLSVFGTPFALCSMYLVTRAGAERSREVGSR